MVKYIYLATHYLDAIALLADREGASLYVSCKLDVLKTCLFQSADKTVEALSAVISTSTAQVAVVIVYRSPGSVSKEALEFIRPQSANRCLVMGDFNLPAICWADLPCDSASGTFGADLLELTLQVSLHQFIDLPTRYMDAEVPSILDLVFAKSLDFVGDITYGPPLGSSDHVCLLFSCTLSRRYQSTVESRPNIWHANYQSMRAKASGFHYGISEDDTVEVVWDKFKSYLTEVSAPFIPVRRRKEARAQPPWIDPTGRHLLTKRSRCWRTYRDAPSTYTYDMYRKARNRCKQHLRNARLNFEKGLADEASENPKRFFAYVKRRCASNMSIPVLMRDDGTHAHTDYDKACVLSGQYAAAFVRETSLTGVELVCRTPEGSELSEFIVAETAVRRLLQGPNPSKASGPDLIRPKLLHELAAELSGPLAIVFQKSLDSCALPSEWKEAVI
ncbi:unnamed protein product [Dicrocoelium dendriticum]|nr:unnamed protein product [Dicrocoelium dendriticum]